MFKPYATHCRLNDKRQDQEASTRGLLGHENQIQHFPWLHFLALSTRVSLGMERKGAQEKVVHLKVDPHVVLEPFERLVHRRRRCWSTRGNGSQEFVELQWRRGLAQSTPYPVHSVSSASMHWSKLQVVPPPSAVLRSSRCPWKPAISKDLGELGLWFPASASPTSPPALIGTTPGSSPPSLLAPWHGGPHWHWWCVVVAPQKSDQWPPYYGLVPSRGLWARSPNSTPADWGM